MEKPLFLLNWHSNIERKVVWIHKLNSWHHNKFAFISWPNWRKVQVEEQRERRRETERERWGGLNIYKTKRKEKDTPKSRNENWQSIKGRWEKGLSTADTPNGDPAAFTHQPWWWQLLSPSWSLMYRQWLHNVSHEDKTSALLYTRPHAYTHTLIVIFNNSILSEQNTTLISTKAWLLIMEPFLLGKQCFKGGALTSMMYVLKEERQAKLILSE